MIAVLGQWVTPCRFDGRQGKNKQNHSAWLRLFQASAEFQAVHAGHFEVE
jgi:hypothetical protein